MSLFNNWLFLSVCASFFFIGSELIYKFTDCSNIQPKLYVSILWIISGIISLMYYLYNNLYQKKISYSILSKISIIALLLFFGNLIYWTSSNKGPNPGLTRAVFSGSLIILLIILSRILFKNKLSIQQTIGILLIIIGTIIIGFHKKLTLSSNS